MVERELDDSPRPRDRDRLDRDSCVAVPQGPPARLDPLDQLARLVASMRVLDPGVEVLRVLPDHDEVDVVEAGAHPLVALARPHLGVEVEALAQGDVHRPEADADGRRDRPLQRDARTADGVQDLVGKRVAAVLVHHVRPCLAHVPVELGAGRLQHAARRLGELGARPVAGYQGDLVRHGAALYRRSFGPGPGRFRRG
jgi:hypothetical protein